MNWPRKNISLQNYKESDENEIYFHFHFEILNINLEISVKDTRLQQFIITRTEKYKLKPVQKWNNFKARSSLGITTKLVSDWRRLRASYQANIVSEVCRARENLHWSDYIKGWKWTLTNIMDDIEAQSLTLNILSKLR